VGAGTLGSDRNSSLEIVAGVDGVDDDAVVAAGAELELDADFPDDPQPTASSALTTSTAANVVARTQERSDQRLNAWGSNNPVPTPGA
jgi:hypothetical protein